jgi:hypothetical protein
MLELSSIVLELPTIIDLVLPLLFTSIVYHIMSFVVSYASFNHFIFLEIMDPLKNETDEPLEDPNFFHSSNDLDAPKSSSHSLSQRLVGSFTLKEEGMLSKRKSAKASFCLFCSWVIFL